MISPKGPVHNKGSDVDCKYCTNDILNVEPKDRFPLINVIGNNEIKTLNTQ